MSDHLLESNPLVGISEARKERDNRHWRFAFLGSLVAHVLVFVLWPSGGNFMSPFAAAGPRAGDDQAASGGMQAMNVRVPPPRPLTPPKIPLPVSVPIEVETFDQEVNIETAQILGERPGDAGPGVENGEGQGDGGTAAEGLFRLMPPSPRGMIIPPANRNLKGEEIQVWVFVDERGRVVADSTALRPPTSDRGFNERLIREAAEWIFEPAKKGGKAVAAWFPYTISMDR